MERENGTAASVGNGMGVACDDGDDTPLGGADRADGVEDVAAQPAAHPARMAKPATAHATEARRTRTPS